MNEIEKEQKKIYDDQTKAFMKDRKANAAEKIKPLDPLKAVAGGYVAEGLLATYASKDHNGNDHYFHAGKDGDKSYHVIGNKNTNYHPSAIFNTNNSTAESHAKNVADLTARGKHKEALAYLNKHGKTTWTHLKEETMRESVEQHHTFRQGDVVHVQYHDIAGKTEHGTANVDKATSAYVHVQHPKHNTMIKFHQGINGKGGNEVGTLLGSRSGGHKIVLKKDTNESVEHKVGDTVWAKHPVKRYQTMTGKVTRIGNALTTITHKDGTTGTYPHKDVSGKYETLNPNKSGRSESVDESEFKGTPKVSTDKYSWGTMKTIHHGQDFSIPLHPEHHQAISKLKDNESHSFQDETKAKWTATRKGDTVHFAGKQGYHTAVPHASLHEDVNEGKMVPTHSASGKPNPNHPAFATHKAKYDADKKAAQAPRAKATPTESPVKLHHIDSAISNSYPDVEPYEHLARKFPDLHKVQGKTGSKLMDHLHDVVKKHKAGKDYHDYVNKAHADIKSDAEFDKRNESVDESDYTHEIVANKIHKEHPNIKSGVSGEDEILGHAHKHLVKMGLKHSLTNDEDLAGDITSHYRHIQKHGIDEALRIGKLLPGSKTRIVQIAKKSEPGSAEERNWAAKRARHTKTFGANRDVGVMDVKEAAETDSYKDSKKPFNYAEWKAQKSINAPKRGKKDAEALGKNMKVPVKEDMKQPTFKEYLRESFSPGKTVYTSHTDKILKGTIVGKDDDNKDHYIVQHKDSKHAVHKDSIHLNRAHAKYMHESVESIDEKKSHQYKTTVAHIENPTVTQRMAAHDIKPGTAGYADRIALLRDAKAKGNLKNESLDEGTLEKSSLSKLWNKYKDSDYTSDQGYGNGSNSMKHNSKAAEVIYNHVASKHGKHVADDMKTHSNLSTYVAEYGHGKDARDAEKEMQSLRKKHGISESVFDWKKNKSEVDWKSDDKKTDKSGEHKGTYGSDTHVAPNDRKADGTSNVPKKSVGRPAGEYQGQYKIDRAKREDPKNKEELSKKVMAAKAEGFKVRAEYKAAMETAIKKRQEELWHANPANKK